MSFEKPTKYVFHLTPENAQYFESLRQNERHELINEIITKHYRKKSTFFESKVFKSYLKYIIVTLLIIFIGVPVLVGFVTMAFKSTKENYDYFTHGFVKYKHTQQNRR